MNKHLFMYVKIIGTAFILLVSVALCFYLVTSCTISVTTLHTQGQAEDVVDETMNPSNQVNPNVNVPITPKAK